MLQVSVDAHDKHAVTKLCRTCGLLAELTSYNLCFVHLIHHLIQQSYMDLWAAESYGESSEQTTLNKLLSNFWPLLLVHSAYRS